MLIDEILAITKYNLISYFLTQLQAKISSAWNLIQKMFFDKLSQTFTGIFYDKFWVKKSTKREPLPDELQNEGNQAPDIE